MSIGPERPKQTSSAEDGQIGGSLNLLPALTGEGSGEGQGSLNYFSMGPQAPLLLIILIISIFRRKTQLNFSMGQVIQPVEKCPTFAAGKCINKHANRENISLPDVDDGGSRLSQQSAFRFQPEGQDLL